jgi:mono/diheme cytochrome c family protein
MLGNCAHCHNPRGFPSVTKPELTNMLNFLPDGKDGGIFGFPFERFSPIRTRGSNGDIPIPYITPSLRDYPTTLDDGLTRIDTGENIVNSGAITYTSKSFPAAGGAKACDDQSFDLEFSSFCGDRTSGPPIVAAPWRSLIYRNVDTPAAYFDDFVPFPHMPMNTAGYDCRAPRIMGDWMTGLPSVRKLTQLADLLGLPEMAVPSEDTLPKSSGRAPVFGALTTGYDDNPQPYVEVPPGNPLYARALTDARARMVEYHAGVRYPYCQDVISPDIFDPFVPVVEPQYTYHPDPYEYQFSNIIEQPPLDPIHPDRFVQPRIGVPFHAHWINYDPTDPPPPWVPRRTDWQDIIVGGKPDTQIPAGSKSLDQLGADAASAFRRKRGYLARALAESELSDKLRTDATTDRAFGTWVRKPGCVPKLTASQQTVSQLMSALGPGETPPAWINFARPAPDAFVYKMSPGAAIFRHVCINCHGPNADGKGIQVDLLASASEGEARPANFKQGLFGPPEAPLSNIATTFDVAKTGDMSAANLWASRYMAWMALGGTLKRIPQDILHLVISTPMLGYHRDNILSIPGSTDSTGNMLNLAKGLCAMMLPAPTSSIYPADYENLVAFSYRVLSESGSAGAHYPPYNYDPSPLISSTYDREMWLHLCNDFSPQVIRVYGTIRGAPEAGKPATIQLIKMYYAIDPDHANDPSYTGNFPANAQIWDPTKTTQPQLTRDNFYPACLDHLKIPDAQLAVGHAPGSTAPLPPDCPDAFLRDAKPLWIDDNLALDADQQLLFAGNVQVWELRGAIAAGMSVFSYLEKRLTDPSMAKLSPYYDQCDLLP